LEQGLLPEKARGDLAARRPDSSRKGTRKAGIQLLGWPKPNPQSLDDIALGFRYMGGIATPENLERLLVLVDKVAGSRFDTTNVIDIDDLLADSPQM
jgi:hypothetical protein